MRLGHRMIVDLRAHTEYEAFHTHDYDTGEIRSVARMFKSEWVILRCWCKFRFLDGPMTKAHGPSGGRHARTGWVSWRLRLS